MLESLITPVLGLLLKGLGLGLTALTLYFSGKSKGKDELTIKSQTKEIKDAKDANVLKATIDVQSDSDLLNGLR